MDCKEHKINISPNWTDAERLSAVGKIAEELLNHPMCQRDEALFDIQERLRFLSTWSASALEANREDIINGKRVSQPKCNEPQAPPSETHPPCTFCRREGIDPPAMGSKATGSYRDVGSWDVDKPKVFNGYVCDMHHDNVVWVSFRWATTPQLITVDNCHGGNHNDPTKM